MERTPVTSSAIKSVGYEGGILEVEMSNGGLYQYEDFPEDKYRELLAAESPGRYFQSQIRPAFAGQRVQ